MDGSRFDRFARHWSTAGSRRGVVQGLLGTAVAGVVAFQRSDEAAAGRCRGQDQCDGTGSPNCGGSPRCFCYRRQEGGTVCGNGRSINCDRRCRRDRNCPRGYVCSSGGPACCGRGKKFCVKKC